jgi:hypothetical protein
MKIRNPKSGFSIQSDGASGQRVFSDLPIPLRSFQNFPGVAASRQSAANLLFLSKECGALPRRRYAVQKKAPLFANP